MSRLFYLIVLFCIAFNVALADEKTEAGLKIVTKSEWGAYKPRRPVAKLDVLPPAYVIVSHTTSNICLNQDKCMKHVRNIQDLHVKQYGWDAIGYNFLVGGDGNIYEGRGWDVTGAHTRGYNAKSIGLSFIGDFTGKVPTDVQIEAAKALLEQGVKDGKLTADYKILGQRQVMPTLSPGSQLYNIIKTWSHWSESP